MSIYKLVNIQHISIEWDDIMKLELENVGKINQANIELNGITIIAGENNTGKSTIGKMLFCVFHAFYKIEEQIKEERTKSISRVLNSYYHEASNRFTRRFDTLDLAKYIVEQQEVFLGDTRILVKEIEKFYISKDQNFQRYIGQDALEKLVDRIYAFLKLEDGEIQKIILRKRLEAEFQMKVAHLNHAEKEANVKVGIKGNSIEFTVINNEDISITSYMNLTKEIIYIDDPFVLDDLGQPQWYVFLHEFGHRQDLLKKLASDQKVDDFSVVDELIVQKKLEKILGVMQNVCDGNIVSDDSNTFVYKTDKLNGALGIVNLSTGMKNFVILRRLLQNGNIDENGIIILDEPEIHLHPEWQLKFAEIIVLIQKEFNTNILLNTHSPYFLNAIEVYSEKYQIDNKCKYYLVDENNKGAIVSDVTNNTEKIYAKLAKPLQKLENLEYGDDNTGV